MCDNHASELSFTLALNTTELILFHMGSQFFIELLLSVEQNIFLGPPLFE